MAIHVAFARPYDGSDADLLRAWEHVPQAELPDELARKPRRLKDEKSQTAVVWAARERVASLRGVAVSAPAWAPAKARAHAAANVRGLG